LQFHDSLAFASDLPVNAELFKLLHAKVLAIFEPPYSCCLC